MANRSEQSHVQRQNLKGNYSEQMPGTCHHQGNYRLKQQWNTTTRLLGSPDPKGWWHWLRVGQGGSGHSTLIVVRVQNGVATLENSVVFSFKTQCSLAIQSSNCSPGYLLRDVKVWSEAWRLVTEKAEAGRGVGGQSGLLATVSRNRTEKKLRFVQNLTHAAWQGSS